jgi:hypothetical protein
MLQDLGADSYSVKGRSGIYALDLSPADRSAAGLKRLVESRGAQLIDGLARRGAVLIRGSGVRSVEDFESLWTHPFLPWDGYRFMERSRQKKGRLAVSSNYKTGDYGALGYHQENHSLPLSLSPDWLAFFCQKTPELGGETGLINVADAFASLSPGLKARLEAHATTSCYRINAAEWSRQFGGAFEPDRVESETRRHGVTIKKLKRSSVKIEYRRPYVLRQRFSGLSAVHFERRHVEMDNDVARKYLRAFQPHHIAAIQLPGPVKSLWHGLLSRRNSLLARVLRGASISALKMTKAEVAELADAWSHHVIAVPYQVGDILVIDNTIIEHTALAWKGEREISVVMGAYAEPEPFAIARDRIAMNA